jgi:hypothetical protein
MATKEKIVRDQVNIITLQCAKDWHKAFKDQNKKGFAPGDLPRSIVIPFADIEQIATDFRNAVQETVNGVRIYFVIKPGKRPNGRPNISGICVPTKGVHAYEKDVTFTDMVIKATLKAGTPTNPDCPGDKPKSAKSGRLAVGADAADGSDGGYASIYDVTRPCPPYCDPESPINGEE